MAAQNVTISSPKQRLNFTYKSRGAWLSAGYFLMGRSLHQINQCPSAWQRRGMEEDQKVGPVEEALWTLLVMPEAPTLTMAVRPTKVTRTAMKCPSCESVTYTNRCMKCDVKREPYPTGVGWSRNIPECKAWEENAELHGRVLIGSADWERCQAAAAAVKEPPLVHTSLTGPWVGCLATGALEVAPGRMVNVCEPVLAIPPEGAVDDDAIYLLHTVPNAIPSISESSLEWRGAITRGALALDLVNWATGGVRTRVRFILAGAAADAEPGFCELSAAAIQVGRRVYLEAAARYMDSLATGQWPGYDHDGAGNVAWRVLDAH